MVMYFNYVHTTTHVHMICRIRKEMSRCGGSSSPYTIQCNALLSIALLNGNPTDTLAGPLHGLANQECLSWLLDVQKQLGHVASLGSLERESKVVPSKHLS